MLEQPTSSEQNQIQQNLKLIMDYMYDENKKPKEAATHFNIHKVFIFCSFFPVEKIRKVNV